MRRRDALKALLGTAAGLALSQTVDLEKLLWTPGQKTIFLPPAKAMAFTLPPPPCRYDVLFGHATLRPDFAVRVYGESAIASLNEAQREYNKAASSNVERIIREAAKRMAQQVDRDILKLY